MFGLFPVFGGEEVPNIKYLRGQGSFEGGVWQGGSGEIFYVHARGLNHQRKKHVNKHFAGLSRDLLGILFVSFLLPNKGMNPHSPKSHNLL